MSMPHIRAAYRLSIDARRVTQELTQTPMEITDRALLDRIGPRSRKCARLEAFLDRSEEHTSELQSLMRISYAVFCLKKKKRVRSKHKKSKYRKKSTHLN